ncbi:MAG TPA: FG-GAP-like repeat-containing protein [Myxococcota bacterium]|nr:FG-GAP-like repeat-containing protein [Myxococcota bacterium]
MWACGDASNETKSDTRFPDVSDTTEPSDIAEPPDPEVTPTGCTINGTPYMSGDIEPNNPCRSCDLATPNAWTAAEDGTPCNAGRCTAGVCVRAPRVDGASPTCAANRGGDAVTVFGSSFARDATATIAGLPAALEWAAPQRVTLTVPSAPTRTGEVPIVITNPDGQSGTNATPFRLFDGLAFEPPRTLPFDALPGRFVAGDVDGDGTDDLVFPLSGAIQVARQGQTAGRFGSTTALSGCDPYAVAVLDATGASGDGLADIVAVCVDGLKVFESTAGGLPTLVAGTPNAIAPSRQIAAGHFDDDAFLDLAVLTYSDPGLTLFKGAGDGTFTASAPISLSSNPAWIDAGDLNGDGLDDLVTAHTELNRIEVLLANPSGTFSAPLTLETASPGTVHLARIDADAIKDLVVSSQDLEVSASWFRSLGDGTFAPRFNLTNGGLIGATIGDFNEDGLGDAIVNSGEGIRVFPGNGDGSFDCTLTIPMDPAPQYLLVGDFDGNGRLDIAGRNASLNEYYLVMQAAP